MALVDQQSNSVSPNVFVWNHKETSKLTNALAEWFVPTSYHRINSYHDYYLFSFFYNFYTSSTHILTKLQRDNLQISNKRLILRCPACQ